MTDRTGPLLAVSAAIVVVAVVASVLVSSPVVRGVVIGAALGAVNLILGSHLTRRSVAGEPGAVLTGIAAGFGARFVALIVLLAMFTFAPGLGVSPAAFGFTFVAFVFVHFAFESAFALRLQRQEAA